MRERGGEREEVCWLAMRISGGMILSLAIVTRGGEMAGAELSSLSSSRKGGEDWSARSPWSSWRPRGDEAAGRWD